MNKLEKNLHIVCPILKNCFMFIVVEIFKKLLPINDDWIRRCFVSITAGLFFTTSAEKKMINWKSLLYKKLEDPLPFL